MLKSNFKRFHLLAALVGVMVGGPAMAAEDDAANEHYCHRFIKTAFVKDLAPGCQPGDTLILQISKQVGPGPIIGQLCDLRHEVWTEQLAHQDTVVCIYRKKKARAK